MGMFRFNRRAVSEVVGVLLVAAIIVAASVAYLTYGVHSMSSQSSALTDAMRQAQKRSQILLSLTYYEKKGNTIHLYIYNYGILDAKIDQLYVQGNRITAFTVKDMDTGQVISGKKIPASRLVDLYFTRNLSGEVDIFLVTGELATFAWKISL